MSKEIAKECDFNPVFRGIFEWGDKLNTKVVIYSDGSGEITQGNKTIILDRFGFFKDVVQVFESAIEAMPDGDLKTELIFHSLKTSRSFQTTDWK